MTGPRTALVGDIGGTNARFALADLDTLAISDVVSRPCTRFGSLEAAAGAYLAERDGRPALASLAVAGPVAFETIRLTNSGWSFTRDSLKTALGLEKLLVVNDFEALAHALPHLGRGDLVQIGGTAPPVEHATKAAVGPGTGLGVGGLVWSEKGWIAVPSEGGHVGFAAEDAGELAIIEKIRIGKDHLSAERVLSGPGLVALYEALADATKCAGITPAEVVERARSGGDPAAREALDHFVFWLGRFCGDVGLMFGARGGVYLAGGIAPRIADLLQAGTFRAAFEDKGRLKPFLEPIPLFLVTAADAGLKGAAAALRTGSDPAGGGTAERPRAL